jgi:hypothetical protein
MNRHRSSEYRNDTLSTSQADPDSGVAMLKTWRWNDMARWTTSTRPLLSEVSSTNENKDDNSAGAMLVMTDSLLPALQE